MVDFAAKLREMREQMGIVPTAKPVYPHGKLTAWRRHHTTQIATPHECEWELGPYNSASFGVWTVFRLTKGGVTGHESVTLIDDTGVHLSTLNSLLNQPYWSCCAGTTGRWDEQRIPRDELRRILVPLIDSANRSGPCWLCSDSEAILAEDPFLLRVADRYEYNYWCASCHSARDKEQSPSESAYQA